MNKTDRVTERGSCPPGGQIFPKQVIVLFVIVLSLLKVITQLLLFGEKFIICWGNFGGKIWDFCPSPAPSPRLTWNFFIFRPLLEIKSFLIDYELGFLKLAPSYEVRFRCNWVWRVKKLNFRYAAPRVTKIILWGNEYQWDGSKSY